MVDCGNGDVHFAEVDSSHTATFICSYDASQDYNATCSASNQITTDPNSSTWRSSLACGEQVSFFNQAITYTIEDIIESAGKTG